MNSKIVGEQTTKSGTIQTMELNVESIERLTDGEIIELCKQVVEAVLSPRNLVVKLLKNRAE